MTEEANHRPENTPRVNDDHVIVGRILGPWGMRGDVRIQVLTDFPERFSKGSKLYLDGSPTRVERSRHSPRGLLIKLEAVKDRTDAEKLAGRILSVPEDSLEKLPEGSYYQFQIIGMEVVSEEGERLGVVEDILITGSNDVYVVKGDGGELLLPAIEDVVLNVNVESNRMTVRLVEGLRS